MNKKENPELKNKELVTEKQLPKRRSLFMILMAILAFLWFLAGGSATTVLSAGGFGFQGVVIFLIRNPLSFLIIGFIQIILGVLWILFFTSFIWLSIFHFLWSIRWFYGFKKYRSLKEVNE